MTAVNSDGARKSGGERTYHGAHKEKRKRKKKKKKKSAREIEKKKKKKKNRKPKRLHKDRNGPCPT
jgi:hypothetical protein